MNLCLTYETKLEEVILATVTVNSPNTTSSHTRNAPDRLVGSRVHVQCSMYSGSAKLTRP